MFSTVVDNDLMAALEYGWRSYINVRRNNIDWQQQETRA